MRHRNLVSNAVRCGKAAKVTVSETGEGAEIILTGRGPGLPEEKLLEVFEPYKRLDTSRSRETCGMGLGFAIVENALGPDWRDETNLPIARKADCTRVYGFPGAESPRLAKRSFL